MSATLVLLFVIALFVLIFAMAGFKVVKQSETMVVERLGKFNRQLSSGINIIWPIIDKPRPVKWRYVTEYNGTKYVRFVDRPRIDIRETVYDFPRQNVITKDNVNLEINALLYFQIMDPVKAVYEIENLPDAIEKLTQTTLRNVIGELELDETLTSRDTINTKLRLILDEATNKWGVKVNRVELQDINPPVEIRQTMENRCVPSVSAVPPSLKPKVTKKPPFWKLKVCAMPKSIRHKAASRLRFCVPKPKPKQKSRLPKPKPRVSD